MTPILFKMIQLRLSLQPKRPGRPVAGCLRTTFEKKERRVSPGKELFRLPKVLQTVGQLVKSESGGPKIVESFAIRGC